MNKNVLKIIEALGYRVEYKRKTLKIYDENGNLLNKKIVNNDEYKGFNYVLDNGREINFRDDYLEIKVDDNLSIMALNLYNDLNMDNIKLLITTNNTNNCIIDFDVYREDISGIINVDVRDNQENNKNRKASLSINDSTGVIISCYRNHLDSMVITDANTYTYINIIVDFIGKVMEYLDIEIKDGFLKAFALVKPSLENLISNLIEIRLANYSIQKIIK